MTSTYLCVGYEAYTREIDEPTTTKFWQHLVLYCKSNANTNVTYDLGSYVSGSLGTFWTAAIADTTAVAANPAQGVLAATTAGAVATAALAALQNIAGVLAENCYGVQSPYLWPLIQVASGASTSQYQLALSNNMASITFGTTTAPTTTQAFLFTWDLSPGNHGIKLPVSYF